MNGPCSQSKCVAMAVRGGLCAAHAAGHDQFNGNGELRCTNCKGLFKKHEWYQRRDGGVFHTKKCATYRDVLAEQEKAAKAVTA